MSIVATDLIAFASINVAGDPPGPTADDTVSGGAIDEDYRVVFTYLAANDDVEVLSSAAGDTTQQATVVARDAAGSDVTETVTLNGTTAVIFSTIGVVQRILSFTIDETGGAATGVITLRRSVAGTTVSTVPVGERGFICLFRYAEVPAAGSTVRYEKFFWKNTHGSLALQDVVISEDADPTGKVEFALEDDVDDAASVANRVTAPASADIGATGFGNADLTMATEVDDSQADLLTGEAIGVWVKLTLTQGDEAIGGTAGSTWTSKIAGTST